MWDQAAGGIKLMVADIQWQQANKLLQAFEDEKRTNFRCPACNSSNIEYVSTYKKRINLLNAVMQALLFSYAMPAKAWRCFDCGNECKDPKETFPGHS
jgi:DNA-directed RNA polymerase subunit RPC12/RpoP